MSLRWYQSEAVDATWEWLCNQRGNPVIMLPTGSGKSHVIGELCSRGRTAGGGWKPSAEECFPRIRERSAETTDGLDGRSVQLFRFSLGISVLEEYAPKSPEWIDSQAAKRREKKQKKERESMPLFSDQIAELQEEQKVEE